MKRGTIMLQMILFGGISVIVLSGFILWTFSALTFSLRDINRAQAFAIAEAGMEYYRWHLAHNPTDYYDGKGATSTGPYVHNYYDKNGQYIGQFLLNITPPPQGSTVVTIESTGVVASDPTVRKIIEVRLGIPSFAKYAIAGNSDLRFGSGTEVFGEITTNGGIRFDGVAHNLVRSARATYDDPDHSGAVEFGVHTHVAPTDPLPPSAVPSRTDVFTAGREFPVPATDFVGITQDLASIKSQAQSGGVYIPTSTTGLGYELVVSSTGRYTINRVTSLSSPPSGCTNTAGQTGWGTWSIQNSTAYSSGTIPSNGVFFVEDNLWVRGKIDNKRITIGSGKFPDNASTRTSITINQDLLYTNYNASDTIALIAQNNINVGLFSTTTLRIDAALVAQNGRIGRFYYESDCAPYHVRNSLTSYGMIASSQRYGFAYTDGTGYATRNLIYDANLLYTPPPSFPLTSDQYVQISWEEVQ